MMGHKPGPDKVRMSVYSMLGHRPGPDKVRMSVYSLLFNLALKHYVTIIKMPTNSTMDCEL